MTSQTNLRITHEDYSNCVASHPYLPVYISGNHKGLVCQWKFEQQFDQVLACWMMEGDIPPNNANPKK